MLFRRVTLFRFFGFKVKADASWLFLSVLICWTLSNSVFPGQYPGQDVQVYQIMSVMALAGIIVSIIAHEVAHAIIAEYYSMPILSITLFIFGGVAEMKGPPSHPKGEFLMALAGPAMSGMMGLLFYAGAGLCELYFTKGVVAEVFAYLGYFNIVIALFNLIPAFPLDGGRALRAAIWQWKNNLVLATRIVSGTGYAFAYVLMGYACYALAIENDMLSGIWSGVLGLFIHGAAHYAVRHVESQSLLASETVSRFMRDAVVSVAPEMTLTALVGDYAYRHFQKVFPVIDRGMLVGVVRLQTVMNLDRNKWQWLHVSSVMEQAGPHNTVAPDMPAGEALELMQRQAQDSLFVARDRRLVGMVSLQDMAHFLSIALKVDQDGAVATAKKAY